MDAKVLFLFAAFLVLDESYGGLLNPSFIPAPQTIYDPFCIRLIPAPLLLVNPSFTFYTRDKRESFRLSSLANADASVKKVADAGLFQKGRQIVFIVHGFFGNLACPVWTIDMKNAILKAEDSTVVLVSWGWGADNPAYHLASVTTQTTSSAIAAVAEAISKTSVFSVNATLDDLYLYCVGHSLGSHICGQAGRAAKSSSGVQLFDRVTGLDPAGPGFESCTDHLNIDKDSAACVDNIHSDGTLAGHTLPVVYYGTLKPWGHIDFYPNGGVNQPACDFVPLENDASCNHMAAVLYYILSVQKKGVCGSLGVCAGEVSAMPKSCSNQTQIMGYYSSCYKGTPKRLEGNFYVDVKAGGTNPNCTVLGLSYCATLEGILWNK